MFPFLLLALAVAQPFDLTEKVAQIDIEAALPQLFLADYPGGFRVMIRNRAAQELRFEGPGYRHPTGLELGWTLDQALAVLPPPRLVVTGVANNGINGVLYRDINRTPGWHY